MALLVFTERTGWTLVITSTIGVLAGDAVTEDTKRAAALSIGGATGTVAGSINARVAWNETICVAVT